MQRGETEWRRVCFSFLPGSGGYLYLTLLIISRLLHLPTPPHLAHPSTEPPALLWFLSWCDVAPLAGILPPAAFRGENLPSVVFLLRRNFFSQKMCQLQFFCTMKTTAVLLTKNECCKNEYKCFFFFLIYCVSCATGRLSPWVRLWFGRVKGWRRAPCFSSFLPELKRRYWQRASGERGATEQSFVAACGIKRRASLLNWRGDKKEEISLVKLSAMNVAVFSLFQISKRHWVPRSSWEWDKNSSCNLKFNIFIFFLFFFHFTTFPIAAELISCSQPSTGEMLAETARQ